LGEALDVVDLVQQDQGQHLADAGDRLQAGVGLGVVYLGGPAQVQLQPADLRVVGVDQGQIDLDGGANARVGEAGGQGQAGAVLPVGELLGQCRQVVLAVGVDQVGQGLGPAADQVAAAA